jgi:hypothetical protein
MDNTNWKEFKIEDLFGIKTSKGIDSNKITLQQKPRDGLFQFIGRTKTNYGIQGFIVKQDFEPNNSNLFSLSQIGSVHTQFRNEPWYSSQNMFVLTPLKSEIVDKETRLFFETAINKTLMRYADSYSSYPTLVSLKEILIKLPALPDGSPDYEFMADHVRRIQADHVRRIQADHVRRIQAYLEVAGLSDTVLTEEEEGALALKPNWREFKIEDLFNIHSAKAKYNANAVTIHKKKVENSYPYIVRTKYNNGMRGFIVRNSDKLNFGKTISFGQDTFVCFYQENPYFTGDKIKIMDLKRGELNRNIGAFLVSAVTKAFAATTWGQIASLNNTLISLPALPDGTPDYAFMETYIRATQKRVIKNLVDWNAKELAAYQSVI